MIETERLILRPPSAADRAGLHAMWADPVVMADLGPIKSEAESDAAIARHAGYGESHGLGFWAVEHRAEKRLIGFCGLKPGAEDTPIAGEVEIGWMLAPRWWGKGYAREAASASLDWAWVNLEAPRVVAITAACNLRSQALMERLGMRRLGPEFDHPAFDERDTRRRSVVFVIDRPDAAR
jgi:RimJ/RimL family protein N-acetyltransferase